jgi:HSP20 family molecular chaperone IbpA
MKRATKSAAKLVVLENNDRISAETEEIQNRIRERAFQLSQERGHAGREMDDWLTAESEIISVPPADLTEKNGIFNVRLAIVGLNLQDMSVMASPEQMLVRGHYAQDHHSEGGTVHLCDFKSATVFRSIRFPQRIDVNSIDVEYHEGILRVSAAKQGAQQGPPSRARTRKTAAKKTAA